MTWLRRRLGEQRGSALVEFVFIALVVFVPLVYIVAGFSAVQRGAFASTAAAQEAGRPIGTAPDPVTGGTGGTPRWPVRRSVTLQDEVCGFHRAHRRI